VLFDGTPTAIEDMIHSGCSNRGSLFLDYGISGNVLSRPGLDALLRRVRTDSDVTHVFIPRRDRLYRPNDPVNGLQLGMSKRQPCLQPTN
jgi:hypothetical protein